MFEPTRLVRSDSLSRDGTSVWLKLELELPTGSFKVRGALYALGRQLERGAVAEVVAASTGNHGAAVAWAAQQLGVRARIFLPRDANPAKVAKIRAYGAELIETGATLTDAIREAEAHAARSGAHLLADASDAEIPVGAGAIGAEVLQQLPAADAIYVPVGDTALIRGVAAEAKKAKPGVRIIGVQSERAPAYYRSWRSGRAEATASADTMADGLATTHPLQPNVDAIRVLVDDFVLVSEDELLDAIAWMVRAEALTIEPASAAAVAAFRRAPSMRNVVLLITGGNIAPNVLRAAQARLTGVRGRA